MLPRLATTVVALAILAFGATAGVALPQNASARTPKVRWHYLSNLPKLETWYTSSGFVEIDGGTYPRSIKQGSWVNYRSYVSFNLKRRCDRLTYTAGMTDDSGSQASAEFSVYGGGRLLRRHQLGFGEHRTASLSVRRVLRLKLEVTGLADDPDNYYSYAAWGNARVRCRRL